MRVIVWHHDHFLKIQDGRHNGRQFEKDSYFIITVFINISIMFLMFIFCYLHKKDI